ncbi:universal stress protein [Rufibacter sp. LB8]|uniref:universal stress protein n=1 Tax=Rufibacter sp. LB8 TaxID=2777781 RepID=UPI00178C2CFE|nr:universal stress protein [Rufibacter sp. LB8]
MKKILVLTDLSDNSVNAYRYAVEMACHQGADVLLVFSSNGAPMSMTDHYQYSQRLHSFAKRYACPTRQRAQPQHLECLLSHDRWAEALPLLVQVHQPDLVIAGSEMLEVVQGEQQAWSLQYFEHCPVLWVPEKAEYKPIQHLVYATDFTDQDPAVVSQLKTLADLFRASVSLVHFYPKSDRNHLAEIKRQGEELRGLLKSSGATYLLMEEEDLIEGLQEVLEKQPVDLFVMATKDTHLAQQYTQPTYRKTQSCQTAIPLLNLYQQKLKSCAGSCSFCHHEHESTAQAVPVA